MSSLTALLALVVIAWLPGAVIFRMPRFSRERRAALDAEERLFWAVLISIAASLIVVMSLGALGQYSFARLLVADVLLAAGAAVVSRFQLRLGPAARRPALTALIPVALVLLSCWRFFPSAEYVAGGRDPGTYVNEGIQIAQRGSLVTHDPVVASVPTFARDLFFPSHERAKHYGTQDYYGLRFMGFWIRDPDTGAVVGQFPHLFPASIAMAYGVDGLSGARRVVGVWAVLGVLAVYFAGARLVGRRAAAAAAALLALHVIQVWFARYPNAEVVMQALLFAALLANARAHVDGDAFFAPVAAVLLGLLLFMRFDAVLGLAGAVAGLVLGTFAGQRPRWTFAAVLTLGVVLVVPYLLGPMRAYTSLYLAFLLNLRVWHILALGAAAAGALAAIALATRRPPVSGFIVRWIPTAITVVVLALAGYALVFRHPGGTLAPHDAYALRMFALLYFGLPALLAALVGFALVARRVFWRDPALLCTIAVFSIFLFYKIRIVPDHFWMARRFLPVILPGALLLVGAAAFYRGGGSGPRAQLVRTLIGVAFVALLASHYARVSAAILPHVEYAGLIQHMEQLAALVEPDDLVIVESRDARSDVHVLALPLAYIYARNVLVLHSPKPDKPTFTAFVEWARTKYGRVLFIGGGGTDLLSHRYGLQSLSSLRFQVPEFEKTFDRLPRTIQRKEFDFGVYRFADAVDDTGLWFDLDVGVQDDLHVVRFHAKERTGDGTRTFRWTGPLSFVSVTTIQPGAREVTLWMSNGGRPSAAPPADVQVTLHNRLLGTVRVDDGFRPYRLPIPGDLAAQAAAVGDPIELKLVTGVWNPAKVIGTGDDRQLGVMVDRVAVR